MKIRAINKTVKKKKPQKSKTIEKHSIPLEFYKGDGIRSFENILNDLPLPIQTILSNGNNPIDIKSSSSIIIIKTDTKLVITINPDTMNDKIPECKIYNKNTKTYLLNTYKR